MDGEAGEAVHGEAGSGVDEVTRRVVVGGETPVRRPALSQTGDQAARRRGAARQTSIVRYAKNPRQEGIDETCCEFFVENAIPLNAAKSKSFKKFQLTCYGPQPAANSPLVPTGYNPLRCRLLDQLRGRLKVEEKVVRDDWEVIGCTFITDGTTNICGRSLMNYILAGRSKPVFIKCEDVSEGEKDATAVVAGWKRFFKEWGVDKVTAICTPSFAGNKSIARMLREDPEFVQIYWIPCTAHCMDLLMHDIGKKEWAVTIIDKGNKVVTFFRVHKWPRSQLRTQLLQRPDLECTCLLRPTQTRFGTNYVMLQRLQVCAKAIIRIVNGLAWEKMVWKGDIRGKALFVKETVLDRAFWADVKKLTTLMKGPYEVLREVDKDVHCLSRIYDLARHLPIFVRSAPLGDKERDDILVDVKNRINMLLSPIHAFEAVVERLIGKRGSKKFDDCLDQLYEFQMARGVFGTIRALQRAKKDNAVLWWEAHGGGHPKIKALAVKEKLNHQRTEKLVYSHWSLRLKSRGDDGPTVVGGWLGLASDWADDDLEGDQAGLTDAVDNGEVGHEAAPSGAGSTTVPHDPAAAGTSVGMPRRGEVEEGMEGGEMEEEEDEDDVNNEDEIPHDEWVDDRSDSDRSWTRREEITPYIAGTRVGLRSQSQRQQVQQHEEQPVEEEEDVEQQHEEQEAEKQHEEHQEKKQEAGQQAEVHEEQQIEVHEEQQIEEQQVEDHEEQHEMHPVEEYDDQHEEQQQADVQQWEDALGHGEQEGEAKGGQCCPEVRSFYGASLPSHLLGSGRAHPGHVWDPLGYRAPRGRGRLPSIGGRGRARAARGTGRPKGRPRKDKQPMPDPAASPSDDDSHESAPLHRTKKRRTAPDEGGETQ
ncbi:hypothetical protein CBR_g24427 [Chara braunii]|uniref:DUF659 domain-containing protein n=1 Tax=Chara braunii TaxID=69332 RepID=A0A388JMP9_CHABU|nr:hypothetical protein CBR_g24427 [Chara braunii]|eukprot:GBG59084.1 hypothetical protein CBR_g24427 [Chara braunii]